MALQKLCVAKIAENIKGYHRIYSTTGKEDLQRGFYLLQKVYSEELLSLLVHEELLQEKYADLVFNKHLRSINTSWLSTYSKKTVVDIFARIGPNLETVIFKEHFHKRTLWKKVIHHLRNVKSKEYGRICIKDFLKLTAMHCPRLETLNVRGCVNVNDDDLKYFYHNEDGKLPCPLLKEIYVNNTSVTENGIAQLLQNMPSLEKIDCFNLPVLLYIINKDHINALDKVNRYNFKHLNLVWFRYKPFYDDILKICITLCPNLKSFTCNILTPEHLNLCSMLSVIENLDLHCDEYKSLDVSNFLKQEIGELTSLTLRGCTFSLSSLGQHCLRLNQLTIRNVTILYEESEFNPLFHNLKAFTVRSADFTDYGNRRGICCILKSSPVLEELCLEFCFSFPSEIKTEILKCCEQCTIKRIVFFWCRKGTSCILEAEFLKEILVTCSTLESLTAVLCFVPTKIERDLNEMAESLPNRPKINISQ